MPSVGVLIVARNAALTIAESIESALAEPVDELLVVDDVSTDTTVEVARSFPDARIRVVELEDHLTLGHARRRGLEELRSEVCMLLDADDLILPGRVERLSDVLQSASLDFVADEIELVDGATGAFLRNLTIPRFLREPPGLMRLFERNYLPGVGQVAFRADSMRRIGGYDRSLHGTEDSDLILRALAGGARYELVDRVGYRMRHFAGSVSRNRNRQSDELAKALGKHRAVDVKRLLLESGAPDRVGDWALVSFGLFCRRWSEVRQLLAQLQDTVGDESAVLEPQGPLPLSEGWRLAFHLGTLELLDGSTDELALRWLEKALAIEDTPETLNNLGVALARKGDRNGANVCWHEALRQKEQYADARDNLAAANGNWQVTALPLRRQASRSDY